MDKEYKRVSVAFEYDTKELQATGSFKGYGSVFNNLDYDRDIVMPGAFKKSLSEWRKRKRLPPVLWQHDTREPLGPYTMMAEDEKGLQVEGLLLVDDVRRAREARALMLHKAIDGLSIGFITRNSKPDKAQNARLITEVELLEVSIVTMPANQKASVTDVKGAGLITVDNIDELRDLREYEELLREAGFSRQAATAFVAKCRKQGDPVQQVKGMGELLKSIRAGTSQLKGAGK